MQNRQNYRIWKWKALHRRRPFYFNLLQVFLALEWLGIHFNLSRPDLNPDSEENTEKPFRNLPFIFFLIHALTFIIIFFFDYGKQLLHHSKGKRLCEWSSFSLVSVAYCLVLLNKNDADDHIYNTSFVSFSMTSAISFLILHHVGIAEPIIVFIKGCILIIWIYYLSISKMTAPEVLAVIMAIFSLHTFGSLLEHEYIVAFRKMGDFENGNGSNGLFVLEASHTLKIVEDLNNSILRDEAESQYSHDHNMTPTAARLMEMKYMCSALHYALLGEDSNVEQYSQFNFRKVCHYVFSILEHATGCGLTLYTDENSSTEVVITAPRVIFEIIVFLFVFEFAQRRNKALYCFTCENGSGEGWILKLQITELENDRDRMPLNLSTNENISTVDTMTKVAGSLDIGQNLLLNESMNANKDPTEGLAEKIVHKYLKTRVASSEPDFKDGLKISSKTIPLTNDVCSVMQKTANGDEAINSALNHKWLLISTRNQDPQMSEFEEKLNVLCVPNITMHLSHIVNKQIKASIAVMSEQYFNIINRDAELKYLKGAVNTLVVLTDSDNVDIDVIDIVCLSGRISLLELLEQVQEITRKLEPRKSSINERSNALFNDNSRRTSSNQPRRQSSDVSRGNALGYSSQQAASKESINRWLGLVKKFRGVILELKLFNSSYYLSVMEDRLKAIAEFKGDDRKTRKLAEELLSPEDAVAAALNSSNKREANLILHYFLPVITEIRQEFKAKNLKNMQKKVATMTTKCTNWGFQRLCFWFTTFQEVIDMVAVVYGKDSIDASADYSLNINQSLRFDESVGAVNNFDENNLVDMEQEQPLLQSANVESAISKVVTDMIDAIEIAVWDAAF